MPQYQNINRVSTTLKVGTCAFTLSLAVCPSAAEAAEAAAQTDANGQAARAAPPTPPAPPSALAPEAPPLAPAPDDSAKGKTARAQEEAEIAAEMAKNQPAPASPASAPPEENRGSAEGVGASASSSGLSNLMNPAISAAGITLGGATSRPEGAAAAAPADLRTGIFLQEVELRASAIVDPFIRADVSLTGNSESVGFEEAYITTLGLPRVTLRAGRMRAAVGRHNILHTHAFPFITAPLPWRALMGAEGLTDTGVSAEILLPMPFFTEVTGQVFQGDWAPLEGNIPDNPLTPVNEAVPDKRRDRDLAYVGHVKTLFDVSDATTIEVGGSYVGGRNGFGGLTTLVAADLTLKWRPLGAERYTGFDWTTEYAWVDKEGAPTDRKRGGGYTGVRYQFGQQWWVQARGAVLGLPESDSGRTVRGEALGAFVPSEFSAFRLQYALEKLTNSPQKPIHEVFLQAIFSVGPHPAHAY